MDWVVISAWGGALLVAVVVLGFCAHEIGWKAKRLQGDLRDLQALRDRMALLQLELTAAQTRISAAGRR